MRHARAALAFGLAFVAAAVHAQDDIDRSRRNAIVRAVERVAPAVVTVNVLAVQYERIVSPFMDDFFGSFGLFSPRYQVREKPVRSVGSGFIFDTNGHILTNYHVVQRADYVSVTLPDGRTLDVEYVGADERSDLAVLRAKGADLPAAVLGDSDELLIGEWMIALGNPFGLLVNDPQPTVSVGVVSAKNRRVNPRVGGGERFYQDLIQTDAAINPGNSGGPIANGLGEVVGVNTFIFSQSGGSVGLGFAIPIKRAKRIADELIRHGRRLNTWPGFTAAATNEGLVVYEIVRDCPAYRAGLRPGDKLVAVNGRLVTDPAEINFAFWALFVGDTATVTTERNGRERESSFVIVELERPR
jgi:serine protease Do